jgi:hypothetical protein
MHAFQRAPRRRALPEASNMTSTQHKDIANIISTAYFEGAFNALDTASMAQGFHPEFAILGADGEGMARFTIDNWISSIQTRKAQDGFDITSAKRDCRIISLDATGDVAAAKVEIYKDGALLYTDYLSLIKFPSGWKIASKVYAEHAA